MFGTNKNELLFHRAFGPKALYELNHTGRFSSVLFRNDQ